MIVIERPIPDQERRSVPDGFDASTGLPNESFWRLVLSAESSRGVRYGRVATVVLVSVVGLDRVAREIGPDVVELTVARVAKLLRSGSRASDYVARVGEARFGVLLTETPEIAAINMVERVRDRCERELSRLAPGVHVAFGWASPPGTSTLVRAAVTAEARLRREAARVIDEPW